MTNIVVLSEDDVLLTENNIRKVEFEFDAECMDIYVHLKEPLYEMLHISGTVMPDSTDPADLRCSHHWHVWDIRTKEIWFLCDEKGVQENDELGEWEAEFLYYLTRTLTRAEQELLVEYLKADTRGYINVLFAQFKELILRS